MNKSKGKWAESENSLGRHYNFHLRRTFPFMIKKIFGKICCPHVELIEDRVDVLPQLKKMFLHNNFSKQLNCIKVQLGSKPIPG